MTERPLEPTALGAVIEDRNGHTWTRTHRPASVIPGGRKPWTIEIDVGFDWDYDDIPAPIKILHPGYVEVL